MRKAVVETKSISLYAVPSDIITDSADTMPGKSVIPGGLLPDAIYRHDANIKPKIATLWTWFLNHLGEKNGYIVGSAALPALSLDSTIWPQALELLNKAIDYYDKVSGPVFVPSLHITRDSQFAVADLYTKLLHGTSMLPIVTFRLPAVPDASPDTSVAEDDAVTES